VTQISNFLPVFLSSFSVEEINYYYYYYFVVAFKIKREH
jgi:hypothetical protein